MNREQLLKCKNKEFAFTCIRTLAQQGRAEDIDKLTNPDFCRSSFDTPYAILREVPNISAIDEQYFLDGKGKCRYYPTAIELFNNYYIICNYWYCGKKHDIKSEFLHWLCIY